jgi:hypothetical protein
LPGHRLAALLFAMLVIAAMPASAAAATVVTGSEDTNAPLAIDPSTTPDDEQTVDVDFGSMGRLAFIQRMPVTKIVSQVTLGDIGSADSCESPVSARLYVHEHPDGNLVGGNQVAYSDEIEQLPATPGKVTWTIPPTRLRKGRGYSFTVGWQNDTCRNGRLTTWAHNQTTVDGGSVRCTGGAPAAPSGNPVVHRMWHTGGESDRDSACVSYPTDWAFHYTMPGGWLATDQQGSYVLSGTSTSQPPATSLCGTSAAEAGARVVYWRDDPDFPSIKWWVCMWPQYGALGAETSDGWYFGMPWNNDSTSAPRDVYLKLDTIDYDAVLGDHIPIYLYDSGENFFILSPGAQTDYYDPDHAHYSSELQYSDPEGNYLRMAVAEPDWADEDPLFDLLRLSYIGESYPPGESPRSGTAAEAADRVSESVYPDTCDEGVDYVCPDYQANAMALQDGYVNHVYGRAVHDEDGQLWLQYWIFFYYNPSPADPFGDAHQGDWEMVQIGLDPSLSADRAVYAQHTGGQTCSWADTEHSGGRPIVYVAESSHASYFGPDRIPFWPDFYDHADGEGGGLAAQQVDEIKSNTPGWVAWPGQWGNNGPRGPQFHEQWAAPKAWADSLDEC